MKDLLLWLALVLMLCHATFTVTRIIQLYRRKAECHEYYPHILSVGIIIWIILIWVVQQFPIH